MNKNLLSLAIATALAAPLAAQAEVKVSGNIQAEVGAAEFGSYYVDSGYVTTTDRQTITDADITGNGNPGLIRFDVTEKLGGGLTGFARFDWEFDSFNSNFPGDSTNFRNREKYLGIKGAMAHIKLGRIQGIYKTSTLGYDKWSSTSLQARNGGGGMSGGNFGHSGFVDDVIEIGFNSHGFKGTLQYVADETNGNEGSILGGLQYTRKNWEVSAIVANQEFSASDDNNLNWKLAGKYTAGSLYMALQYESVETAQSRLGIMSASQRPDGDPVDYIWGQLGYKMGNAELIGWVGWVGAFDLDDINSPSDIGNIADTEEDSRDSLAYSIGAKYHFSKRLFAYAGYHETDSDNDAYDVEAFVGGLRMKF